MTYRNMAEALEAFKRIEGKYVIGSWWSNMGLITTKHYYVVPGSLVYTSEIPGYSFVGISDAGFKSECGMSDEWIVIVNIDSEMEKL